MFKNYKLKSFPYRLIIYLLALSTIGVLLIGSAQVSVQKKQIVGVIAGLLIMLFVAVWDYNFVLRFRWMIYAVTIALLLLVKFAGDDSKGSQRWFEIGGFRFQPSELVKILLILFWSYFFAKYQEKINDVKILAIAAGLEVVPLVLIFKQPDLSTTIVTAFIFCMLLFIAGLSYKIIGVVMAVVVPVFLAGVIYTVNNADYLYEHIYQFRRIFSWLYPKKYPELATQQQNSIMAIGSGQLWGKGLNNSVATSMNNGNWIIEPQTDFIFAVGGEELGFLGCTAIIILLVLIVIECIRIGAKAKDFSGKLICCGMATLVGFQGFVNIGVATGVLPNTGVTLPFVSYGLTSLLSLYIGMGFVVNVALQPKNSNKGVYL